MADLAATDVTYTLQEGTQHASPGDPAYKAVYSLAFGDSALTYPSGGIPLTKGNLGCPTVLQEFVLEDQSDSDGLVYKYDRANGTIKLYYSAAVSQSGATITLTDDDSAASNGVAVYVHLDEVMEQGGYLGHLEFVSPTDADATLTLSNGGGTLKIQDDDNAATGGLALYFDEDGTAGSRLIANTTHTVYIMASNGELVKITHNADPGTPGVQVYCDEDAANSYERLLFVSPTDADGSDTTPANVAMRREDIAAAALSEVTSGSYAPAATTLFARVKGY